MRLLRFISKTSQFGMIFCFCLPFLKGCDGCNGPLSDEAISKMYADADSATFASQDSLIHIPDSMAASEAAQTVQPGDTETYSNLAAPDTSLINAEPEHDRFEKFMSAIIQPNGDFSGFGILWIGLNLGSPGICLTLLPFLLLLLTSIVFSFFNRPGPNKCVFIFSAIELFLLLLFYALVLGKGILYGFWVTTGVCAAHLMLSWYIWKRSKSSS